MLHLLRRLRARIGSRWTTWLGILGFLAAQVWAPEGSDARERAEMLAVVLTALGAGVGGVATKDDGVATLAANAKRRIR